MLPLYKSKKSLQKICHSRMSYECSQLTFFVEFSLYIILKE